MEREDHIGEQPGEQKRRDDQRDVARAERVGAGNE